ncbi:hypothetical protein FQN57_004169 [Myotisia sp. PD_48]|nr:hypothetical protein FQN57_004169 [Myotisia sp. PD_48]
MNETVQGIDLTLSNESEAIGNIEAAFPGQSGGGDSNIVHGLIANPNRRHGYVANKFQSHIREATHTPEKPLGMRFGLLIYRAFLK